MRSITTSSLRRQRGVGLLEVLISMIILALCMLGMAALQTTALRNNQSAQSRSMATILSASIIDAMRANATAARSGQYNVATCANPGGDVLVQLDVVTWILSLKSAIGVTACGGIKCVNGLCDITVQWDDSRATAGDQVYTVTTRIQL
jgi:type IV pilus assembly protein PilV